MMLNTLFALRCSGSEFVRTSLSSNPEKYVAQLQMGCPFDLIIIAKFEFDSFETAFAIECRVWEILDGRWMRSSWMRATDDEIIEAIKAAIQEANL